MKSRRTNVRPNSSINLQVNQGRLSYTRLSSRREEGHPSAPYGRVSCAQTARIYSCRARMHIGAYVTYTRTCSGVRRRIRNTLKCSHVFGADRPSRPRSHASGAATISAILLDVDAPILIPSICCTLGACIMHPPLRGSRPWTTEITYTLHRDRELIWSNFIEVVCSHLAAVPSELKVFRARNFAST